MFLYSIIIALRYLQTRSFSQQTYKQTDSYLNDQLSLSKRQLQIVLDDLSHLFRLLLIYFYINDRRRFLSGKLNTRTSNSHFSLPIGISCRLLANESPAVLFSLHRHLLYI